MSALRQRSQSQMHIGISGISGLWIKPNRVSVSDGLQGWMNLIQSEIVLIVYVQSWYGIDSLSQSVIQSIIDCKLAVGTNQISTVGSQVQFEQKTGDCKTLQVENIIFFIPYIWLSQIFITQHPPAPPSIYQGVPAKIPVRHKSNPCTP